MRDRLKRRVIPRLVVLLSQVTWPARARAGLRRALGGRGRVDLYFAFDDASSAVAVLDLVDRLDGRPIDLVLRPVVERGIPDDPAADDKRRHAIADARRLARRRLLTLRRVQPVSPATTAPLAAHAAALDDDARRTFSADALRRLWIDGDDVGASAAADGEAVRANERAMVASGPYDTPEIGRASCRERVSVVV